MEDNEPVFIGEAIIAIILLILLAVSAGKCYNGDAKMCEAVEDIMSLD